MTNFDALTQASIDAETSWPPQHLPAGLTFFATVTDCVRNLLDVKAEGGGGICLASSGYISMLLIDADIPHDLVNGVYTDDDGEHPHWWVESRDGWILDSSRGQFYHEIHPRRGSVTQVTDVNYRAVARHEPGHSSEELVIKELERCVVHPSYAGGYFELFTQAHGEASDIHQYEG